MNILIVYYMMSRIVLVGTPNTSSTAQGGGGSFKNRKRKRRSRTSWKPWIEMIPYSLARPTSGGVRLL